MAKAVMMAITEKLEFRQAQTIQDLRAENERLRSELDQANAVLDGQDTILVGIGSQVDLWRKWQRQAI